MNAASTVPRHLRQDFSLSSNRCGSARQWRSSPGVPPDKELHDFCAKIQPLSLVSWKQALAILWYVDAGDPDARLTSGRLAKVIHESGLGSPHSTQLGKAIQKSGLAIVSGQGFRLKHMSRATVRHWIATVLDDVAPNVNHEMGYLPEAVWRPTRDYIESVAVQLNGCFEATYYDAASVMLRRLVETLIIEAYEASKRQNEIKNSAGHYLMLGDLVTHVIGTDGLNLGREAKKALSLIKQKGDRAAHNRRYRAVKADLEEVRSGARVVVDELIHHADLRPKSK